MDLKFNILLKQGDFTLDADIHICDRVVGIFGPSGAGKSTMLHLLSGLKKPQDGYIILKDQVLCDIRKKVFVPPEKRDIGVVFQDERLFPHMSVERNILFGMENNVDRNLLDMVIDVLEIRHLLKRGPLNLSGGEKQRVAIARALVRKPKLLLLDEPFSSIDVNLRSSLLPFISRVSREFACPMIIISHDLPDLLCLTNSLVIIQDGKVVGHGDCSDLAFDDRCSKLIKHAGIYATFDAKVVLVDKKSGSVAFCAKNNGQMIKASYKQGVQRDMNVKARLRPEDVVLASERADFITSQNQLKATILRVQDFEDEVLLELDAGFNILSGITRKAASQFKVAPGKEIWIMFKSMAVEYYLL